MTAPLTAAEVQAQIGFDDDVRRRLQTYIELLGQWQPRMNLVGRSTLADPWRRHVLDSAQIWPHLPAGARTLVDMGAGAGFPGLVLAILGVSEVALVEATQKKCAFLEAVAEATGTPVTVRAERLEIMRQTPVDVVTARALAPVAELLRLGRGFLGRHSVAFFLKGGRADAELTEAAHGWKMKVERHPSLSHPEGVLLELRDIHARKRA